MPVERQEARRVTQYSLTPEVCEDGPFKGYFKLHWIRSAAEEKREERVDALMHHLNPHNLRRAFRELDGSRACGVDGVTKTSEHRTERKHQPKSRMREIRTSGSVRRGSGFAPLPLT